MPPVKKFKVARTHGDSLECICAACWRKKGNMRPVNDKVNGLLKTFVYGGYQRDSGYHPTFVFDGCSKTLSDLEKVYLLLQFVINLREKKSFRTLEIPQDTCLHCLHMRKWTLNDQQLGQKQLNTVNASFVKLTE